MIQLLRRVARRLIPATPLEDFHSDRYLRHTQRRLEHLASLRLDLAKRPVLEVGAGIGDHTSFFLDRGCSVLSTDGRAENLAILRKRYPTLRVEPLDLDAPDAAIQGSFEIVYAYGLLYHLQNPANALRLLSKACSGLLLLETCVNTSKEDRLDLCKERSSLPSQSVTGVGCKPSRSWLLRELRQHFKFVYLPSTQPCHEEFPLDWNQAPKPGELTRAIFVASTAELKNPLLLDHLPDVQTRF